METILTRRVDELGRIVIPKEIRSKLKIKRGDCLCIFLDDEKIVFKKQNIVKDSLSSIKNIIKVLSKIDSIIILITDLDKVIYSNTEEIKTNEIIDESITKHIVFAKRRIINDELIFNKKRNCLIEPIIINGDVIGSTIIINNNKISESNELFSKIINNLLINNLEVWL